jgi:hypothetical protein
METKVELQAMGFEPVPVLRAIRAKCLDCSGGSHAEVADCLVRSCALFPFRMGKNPWRSEVSEARREAGRRFAARAKKAGTNPGFDATDGAAAPTTYLLRRIDAEGAIGNGNGGGHPAIARP